MSNPLKILLEIDDSAASKSILDLTKSALRTQKQFNTLGVSGQNAFNNIFQSVSKTLGVFDIFAGNLAANVVTGAFQKIQGSLSQIVKSAAESEQSVQNLNVAMRGAGQFSEESSEDFQTFASSLQDVTKYSDDLILASGALLFNLTALTNDGVKQATQAAVDLAATLNIDLTEATEMISKAVNGNTTAFKKRGIEIQSAATDSERLTNILRALSGQMGTASKQVNTFAGASDTATNQQDELFEALGKVYTQSEAAVTQTKAMSDIFRVSAKFITENTQAIRDFGTAAAITAGIFATGAGVYAVANSYFITMVATLYSGIGAFGTLRVVALSAWGAITAPVTLTVAAIAAVGYAVYKVVQNWEQIKAAVYDALGATLEFAAKAAFFASNGLSKSLEKQAASFRDQAKAIREVSDAAKEQSDEEKRAEEDRKAQEAIRKKRLADAQAEAVRHAAFLKSNAQLNADEIALIERQSQEQILALQDQYAEERALQEFSWNSYRMEEFMLAGQQRLLAQQELDRQELELQIQKQQAKALAENDELKRREALDQVAASSKLSRANLLAKQELEIERKKVEDQKRLDQLRLSNQRDTFSTIATLSSSNNKELAAIGKAAGVAQIAIDTPVAVSKALAAFPPPANFAAAALVGAAMAAQAAQIAGLKFAEGGIVPGTSYSGDLVAANVNSGEMVLNRRQQTELFRMANGGGVDGDLAEEVRTLSHLVMGLLAQPMVVQVDGKELFNITRAQLASGRAY